MRRPGRLVLLGHPLARSLSPPFQQAALDALGFPLRYEAVDVRPVELDQAVEALIVARAAGNVTAPYKVDVLPKCDRLTPEASRAGAVNAFRVEDDDALLGHNTDIGGFDALARSVIGEPPAGMTVALLGAGGAAAAVLCALERWPHARVILGNRTRARAESLAARFPLVEAVTEEVTAAARTADLVINATSLGLSTGDPLPVEPALLRPGTAVIDLVYGHHQTPWVRAATVAGHVAADGTLMLLEQGALAFEFWLGTPAPRATMWAALSRTVAR